MSFLRILIIPESEVEAIREQLDRHPGVVAHGVGEGGLVRDDVGGRRGRTRRGRREAGVEDERACRVDQVLAPEFLVGLSEIPLAELRARRREAEQEEADLSYLRRMLHGRIDIVSAELRRRSPDSTDGPLLDDLSTILGDEQRSTHGLGRHITVEPSRVDEHRRDVEKIESNTRTGITAVYITLVDGTADVPKEFDDIKLKLDSITDLPLHPLVVHAAVVFIPLTCVGTILIAIKRSWRKSLGWWVLAIPVWLWCSATQWRR